MINVENANLLQIAAYLETGEPSGPALEKRLRELHEQQEKINKFLRGESALNGYYFGERPPNSPPFWWRKHLTTTQEDKP